MRRAGQTLAFRTRLRICRAGPPAHLMTPQRRVLPGGKAVKPGEHAWRSREEPCVEEK